jgi:hypothetical protein
LSTVRTLLLAGLLALDGAVLLTPTTAWAEPAGMFEKPGLIELVRPTDIIGDGATPVQMSFFALTTKGEPVTGWKVKMTATGGTATELVDKGNGLFTFTFVPAKTDGLTNATVALVGKLATKEYVEKVWSFPVSPARNLTMRATASPGSLTLGVDKTANLTFEVTNGSPAALATIKLVQNVSGGTLANVTNLGGGQYGGLFTPTATTAQVALITAADAADPSRTYAATAIPMTARIDQAIVATPKSQVILKVGGRDFGPVTTDSKGKAKLSIVVPPGVTTATRVVVGADGAPKEEPFDLKLAETRRVALFPTALALPSDGRAQVTLRAFVVTPDGRPDEAAPVTLTASAGVVGAARHEGGGIYVATWTPPYGNVATKVTLTAKLGDAKVQVDNRVVDLVPVRATKLALTSTPPALPPGPTTFTLTAKPTGPDGAPLPGRALVFSANGAKLQEIKDLKNGEYAATFATTGKGPVEVTGYVATPSTGNPLARVIIVPSRTVLPPDGLSSSMLTVATLDDQGYPVPDTEVTLRIVAGDGSVPEVVRTNANGMAEIYYTAGRKPGFVGIDALANDRSAGVSLLQFPAGMTLPSLPIPTSAANLSLMAELGGAVGTIRIERQ